MNTQPLQPDMASESAANLGDSSIFTDLPPGDHALEVAARRGFGPLSAQADQFWHGNARPCVTCGQLVLRDADACDSCGQELDEDMLEKMRAHAGPWFVLEHVRPFPGVNLDRIIRQISRGLITETSIVRGPSTDYQWRFAVETPGLCRYFGKCWNCHERTMPSDTYCRHCLSSLSFEKPRTVTVTPRTTVAPTAESPQTASATVMPPHGSSAVAAPTTPRVAGSGARPLASPFPVPASGPALTSAAPLRPAVPSSSDQLRELTAALGRVDRVIHDPQWDEPPRIAGIRATWVAAILLTLVIVILLFLVETRNDQMPPPGPGMAVPFAVQPINPHAE